MPEKFNWLIIGLGNPGKDYSKNRHNIGWSIAEALISKYNEQTLEKHKLYFSSKIEINNNPIIVAMPRTYMNNSGKAVTALKDKYWIPLEKIIVVVDEYNFEIGRVHLRLNGGDSGHNGIASIVDWLRSSDFYRLRCGIGNDFSEGELVDYVLSDFNDNEIPKVKDMISKAVESLEYIVNNGIARAMSDINSGILWKN